MEQKPEARDWYAKNSSGDQGIVIDANTGRTVAVAYEARDTAILAAAPEMLAALVAIAEAGDQPSRDKHRRLELRKQVLAAIAKATGN